MIAWVRLILSVFALAGLVAAAPGAALAKAHKAVAPHHHCAHMPEGTCPDDDAGALPACCVASVCAFMPPAVLKQEAVPTAGISTLVDLPVRDDLWHSGIRPPPDLRPPIA